MKRTQRIQLRQSELRTEIGGILDKEDRSEEDTTRLGELNREMRSLETDYQAAVAIEGEAGEPEKRETPAGEDAESKELDAIMKRSSLGVFVAEAVGEDRVDGAERELRQALKLGENSFPIDMLLGDEPAREERADAGTSVTASVAEHHADILGRIFADSAGAYMGVERPMVPIGDTTYVVLTAGVGPDIRSPNITKDAEEATFTTKTVSPVRAQARYLFDIESTYKLRGMESALRRDLTAALADKLDSLALNGQAAVGTTSPTFEGIISTLTNPTNPTATAAWADYYKLYTDRVDGKYSADGSNVRVLVNPATFRQAAGLQIATSGELLIDKLPAGRFRASANMPDAASTIATGITYSRTARRGFVQPVWRSVMLIRDPYTAAAKGQVALTAITLVGAAMVDSGPYHRFEVKIA